MKLLQDESILIRQRQQLTIDDDFDWYISPHRWTSLAADTNSAVSVGDARGGILTVSTGDATDNNEAAIRSTNEVALFAADAPIFFESQIKFTDQASNTGNVAVGMADAAGANLLGDDGAGDAINGSGALIFKVDGETVWRCACECNGTVVETQSTTTAGGSAYQRLAIKVLAVDATYVEVSYFCDGIHLKDSNGVPIVHRLAYASATEMRLVPLYMKSGAAAAFTGTCDRVYFAQRRAA